MSKLDELVERLCPNGVKYMSTKELSFDSFWLMPSTPNYIESGIPYITSKNVKNGSISFDNVAYISREDFLEMSRNRSVKSGDLLITMIGTIGEAAFVEDFVEFYGQNLYLVRLNNNLVNPRFFYHFFISQKDNLVSKKNPSSQGYIKAGSVDELLVPVPPMEVQCEIVRILDNFDELQTKLKDELEKRNVEYKELANRMFEKVSVAQRHIVKHVCSVIKGKSPIQKTQPGDYPMVVTTPERRSSKDYQFDCSAVCIPLISSRGHGVASLNHVYYQSGKFALGNILCAVIPNNPEEINAKYLYYYFELTKDFTLVPLMKGGANVAMHVSDVENVKVPIPTLAEQERIIDALTKYDQYLVNLEAEIQSRQIQYNYYRDKLLTFKELKA